MKTTTRSNPVFCSKDCGGNCCPLLATVEDGRVTRITNNPAGGKYLKGCQRSLNLPLVEYAPDRLLTPLLRVGERGSGNFREATWEEALSITAEKLAETRSRHGANAILNLGSAGDTGAMHGTQALLGRFLNLFGGCTTMTSNYSNGAARFILPYLLGRAHWGLSGFDAATMQYAEMIILWGANVLEARLGTEISQRLIEAKKRGAQIVVIDPRRSTTVQHAATWHISCRPGSDAAMMLAILYVLISEDRINRPFIQAHSTGFDQLERYVLGQDGSKPHTPQWAEPICGVPAVEITRFAHAYASARPAMLFPGYAIQRVYAGEEANRLTIALQLATGNFGQPGGSTGSLNNRLPTPRVGTMPVPAIDHQPSVNVQRWPDIVLEGRRGGYASDIHAIYTIGCNFLNQGNDIRKNMDAFRKVDFAVCHDLFLTPTARFCDVVLPAATTLEKEDIGIPWLGNFLVYKPQTIPPRGQCRCDYDIFCDLAHRLGFGDDYSKGRSAAAWVQHFIEHSEIPDAEAFRSSGIYLAPDQERVGLADFTADPLRHPLSTPSGKVEIACQIYQNETGFPAIPTWQQTPADRHYPLQLITPKALHFTHSQATNLPELRLKAQHALTMNPEDAAARGIGNGNRVKVYNQQGATRLTVHLSENIMPGVVCLPEGMWCELDVDGTDRGGSANMLTSTLGTAPGLACIMHGVGVEVELTR